MFKRRDKAGVSLIELLIAIAVIVVGMSGVAASLYFGFEKSKHGDQIATATQFSKMIVEFVGQTDLEHAFILGAGNLPNNSSGVNDSVSQAPRPLTDPPFEAKQYLGYWSTEPLDNAKAEAELNRYTRNIRIERVGAKGTPEEFLGRITVTVYWPQESGGGSKNYVSTSRIIPLTKAAP